jgi:multiple sugar transport system permease protein
MITTHKSTPYLLLAPVITILFGLMIYPMFWNIFVALHDVKTINVRGTWNFVGIKNFISIFSDPFFYESLKNTGLFILGCVLMQVILGFAIARVLVEKPPAANFFRVIFIIPWLLSASIVGFSWRWMYNDMFGLINVILGKFGIAAIPWVSDPRMALWSLVIANIWFGTPFSILFQESALLTLDRQLYESAKIDGANPFQTLIGITLPILKPFLLMNLILITMWTINIFELMLVMTNGGPLNATTTTSLFMYKQAFQQGKLSLGASVGFILLAINLTITFIYLRLMKEEE